MSSLVGYQPVFTSLTEFRSSRFPHMPWRDVPGPGMEPRVRRWYASWLYAHGEYFSHTARNSGANEEEAFKVNEILVVY